MWKLVINVHTKRSNKHTFTSLVPLRCDELKYSFTRGSCGSLVTNSLYNDEPFKLCRLRQSFPMRDISEELNGNHFVFFFLYFCFKSFLFKKFQISTVLWICCGHGQILSLTGTQTKKGTKYSSKSERILCLQV